MWRAGLLLLVACWRADPEPAKAPAPPTVVEQPRYIQPAPPPPEPWGPDRIQREIRANPAVLLHNFNMGPIVVTDLDAGTNQVLCDDAARVAIDQFALKLGNQVTCQEHAPGSVVCMPLPTAGQIVIVLFQRSADYQLASMSAGQNVVMSKAMATIQSARAMLANPVCP